MVRLAEKKSQEESLASDLPERVTSVPLSRLVGIGLILLVVPVLLTVVIGGHLPDVQVYRHEQILLPVLLLARLFWLFKRGLRLLPLLDLPLLGLAFTLTGADESPLDPALFLIYALLAFFFERSPRPRLRPRDYAVFVVGFVGMYGFVFLHVFISQELDLVQLREELDQRALSTKQPLGLREFRLADIDYRYEELREQIDAARDRSPVVREQAYFGRESGGLEPDPGGRTIDESYAIYISALEARIRLLSEASRLVNVETPADVAIEERQRLVDAFEETDAEIDAVVNNLIDALERLGVALVEFREDLRLTGMWHQTLLRSDPFFALEETRDSQRMTCEEFLSFFEAIRGLAIRDYELGSNFKKMLSQRVAIFILVLATLSLLAGLRFNFEMEVKRRESARTEQEVGTKEREKENWIALTAGLTHTIGNDILAYDAYGEEALDVIEEFEGELPEEIEHNIRFIYNSNKARLSFIKFLSEFAQSRKEATGTDRIVPRGIAQVLIRPLLQAVRAQVGEIEVADLPRDSRDPQVLAQRKKFLELPMDIVIEGDGDEAGRITGGKRGILQFFFYELIKNALRNCSGSVPLRVEISKFDEQVRLRFVNDLAVREITAADGRRLLSLPRISTMEPCTDEELHQQVDQILEHCFEPGKGGGTGLGLFLIRYFAREYYSGNVRAYVGDWSRRLVVFELDIPDDLERLSDGGAGEHDSSAVL